jgi:hypothetical protein
MEPCGIPACISRVVYKLLYDWRFTANLFVLASSPLRSTTRDYFFSNELLGNSPCVTSSLTRRWGSSLMNMLGRTENVSSFIACSLISGETTCPQSCSLATAIVLSSVYTAVIWQWVYGGVPISLWLFPFPIFLFAAQPKEFFLDGLNKLEQRSHKYVELRGNM